MLVWILQTGEPLHIDDKIIRQMRAINLSNKLLDAGHSVVLWSSAFDHQNKIHRSNNYKVIKINNNLEVRLIPSRGYSKHIGFERLIDHAQIAWNLRKLLKIEKSIPDVAFIGYPPIETAFIMNSWLKRKNVPTLLDIKDLWPSIFLEIFPKFLKPFARVLLNPYYYLAQRTMREADGISAVSESFLKWSLTFANKSSSPFDTITRLTTVKPKSDKDNLIAADKYWQKLNIKCGTPKVFFIGTFSTGFDFDHICSAAKIIKECQFVLCGNGPRLNEIKKKMRHLPNVIFPGWIDQSQLEVLANMSIASIAPYKNIQNFTLNIPNKIIDSLSLGVPILSPLKGEVASMIKKNNIGITYDSNTTLIECIYSLINNNFLKKKMSKNARMLYEKEFNFYNVYNNLVEHLENMAFT